MRTTIHTNYVKKPSLHISNGSISETVRFCVNDILTITTFFAHSALRIVPGQRQLVIPIGAEVVIGRIDRRRRVELVGRCVTCGRRMHRGATAAEGVEAGHEARVVFEAKTRISITNRIVLV